MITVCENSKPVYNFGFALHYELLKFMGYTFLMLRCSKQFAKCDIHQRVLDDIVRPHIY